MAIDRFTRRERRTLRKVADQFYASGGSSRQSQQRDRNWGLRYAELTASLSPASNSKTGASTANAKFLIPDPDSVGDLIDGRTFIVTNRSLDLSGLSGDFIIVARVYQEWHIVWIDC